MSPCATPSGERGAAVASDRELMERLRSGEGGALGALMERHHRRVYRIALSYLRDEDEARDVVQETFVKVYHHRERWRADREVVPWLVRIAINQAIDRFRRRRRWRARLEPLVDGDHDQRLETGEPGPERRAAGHELGERIRRAVAALPERQRAVFVLRHQEEMSLEEIAGTLEMSLGTVKSSLHRALRRLRERLEGATG